MSFGCEVFVFGVPGESGVVSERCSSESGVACVQFWRTPQQPPALNYQVNYQKLLSKLLNKLLNKLPKNYKISSRTTAEAIAVLSCVDPS